MFALIVGTIATTLMMAITNEYDAETIAKMIKAAADTQAAAGGAPPS